MDTKKATASDLMNPRVARLDPDTPVNDAATMLEADRISGAPVVDAAGRVLGVFSLADVARSKDADGPPTSSGEFYMPREGVDEEADEFSFKTDYSPATLVTGTVAEWMSEDVVAVAPNDSAHEVCKRMLDRGVHRVLVLDGEELVGILSSFDVVRWIAEKG